jgi:hypothetical protein
MHQITSTVALRRLVLDLKIPDNILASAEVIE